MSALHNAVLTACAVLGIACCGIGGITLFAAGMSDSPSAVERANREGCGFGIAGFVLLALAAGMNWL